VVKISDQYGLWGNDPVWERKHDRMVKFTNK
jgi:hypothetical protein